MMSNRPEVSKSNPYWISKHRFYELKHFCLQYPEWEKAANDISLRIRSQSYERIGLHGNKVDDPVYDCVAQRGKYIQKMDMVITSAKEASDGLGCYILIAVTKGLSYDDLRVSWRIPCCKELYYEVYRRFFKILSEKRG